MEKQRLLTFEQFFCFVLLFVLLDECNLLLVASCVKNT